MQIIEGHSLKDEEPDALESESYTPADTGAEQTSVSEHSSYDTADGRVAPAAATAAAAAAAAVAGADVPVSAAISAAAAAVAPEEVPQGVAAAATAAAHADQRQVRRETGGKLRREVVCGRWRRPNVVMVSFQVRCMHHKAAMKCLGVQQGRNLTVKEGRGRMSYVACVPRRPSLVDSGCWQSRRHNGRYARSSCGMFFSAGLVLLKSTMTGGSH